MHNGRVLTEGEPKTIRTALGRSMLEVWPDHARSAVEKVRAMKGVHSVSLYGDRLHIALEKDVTGADIIDGMRHDHMNVKDYRQIVPSLEDVFIAMVER
jgi:ABC-2 type transport system ATP-binding protein